MKLNYLGIIFVVVIIALASLNIALLERPTTVNVANVTTVTTVSTSVYVVTSVSNSEYQTLQSEISVLQSQVNSLDDALNLGNSEVITHQTTVEVNNGSRVVLAQFQANYSGYVVLEGECKLTANGAGCSICPNGVEGATYVVVNGQQEPCKVGGFVVISSTYYEPSPEWKNLTYPFFQRTGDTDYAYLPLLPGSITISFENTQLPAMTVSVYVEYAW